MARAAPYDRELALNQAMILFWQQGYHATSLKDLETALNMRPGSIYAAFHSKDALFRLALARYFDSHAKQFEDVVAAAPTPLIGLANWIRRNVEMRLSDPVPPACMLAKTTLELKDLPGEAGAEARNFLRSIGTRFAELFAQARRQGDLPDSADPERLSRLFQVKVMGLTLFLQRESDPEALWGLAEDLAQEVEALGSGASRSL